MIEKASENAAGRNTMSAPKTHRSHSMCHVLGGGYTLCGLPIESIDEGSEYTRWVDELRAAVGPRKNARKPVLMNRVVKSWRETTCRRCR